MATEEVTKANLPFGMGSVDFSEPMSALLAVVALILGFVVFHVTDAIGNQGASWVSTKLAALTGADVGSAESGITFGET